MVDKVFDIEIDTIKSQDIDIRPDLKSIRESLFKVQEALAVLSNIIIELNRTTIENDLGIEKNQVITERELNSWSNTL